MGIYGNIKPVNEVYFGKTDEILKIENQLSILRKKFEKKVIKLDLKINTDPELLKFNRMVEDCFGFTEFSLYVVNSYDYNAYTIPIGLVDIKASKKGFKLNPKGKESYPTMVCIYSGLLFDKSFTDSEILAILLHEIGHNFSPAIDGNSYIFFLISNIISIAHTIETVILLVVAPGKLLDRLSKTLFTLSGLESVFVAIGNYLRKKNPIGTKVMDFALTILNGIRYTIGESKFLMHALKMLSNGGNAALSLLEDRLLKRIENMTPFGAISTILGYNGERISDNFATMYGYGSELSSALSKMDNSDHGSAVENVMQAVPLIHNMYQLIVLPATVITTGFDCHPETPSRINQQMKFLQKELDKEDLDPKMKKRINQNIKDIQQVMEDNMFTPYQNGLIKNLGDANLVQKLYASAMYKLCGGDFRDVVYDKFIDNNGQTDKAYEKNKR